MKFYPQDVARDFLYPINKKDISKLYKLALNDISRRYPIIQEFQFFESPKKIYGNIIGLHLREHNEYFEISLPTIFLEETGYQSISSLINRRISEKVLFHKRKHLIKKPGLIVESSHFISVPIPDTIEHVIAKRMIIKLGSVKTNNIILFDFPYLN